MEMCYKFICIVTVTLVWFQTAHTSGRLEIQILNYTNPKGTDVRGYCCDSNGLGCVPNICDPFFKVCASTPSQASQQPCDVANAVSSVYDNQNFIDFTKSSNNLSSLVNTRYQRWEGSVVMKITVVDDDSNEDLNDDTIGVLLGNIPIDVIRGPFTRVVMLDNQGITIYMSIKSVCDINYYGKDCAVKCIPSNGPSSHFTCNQDGTKNCLPGWIGLDCDVIDFCSSDPCLNNGTFSNTPTGVKCTCVNPYSGVLCEISPFITSTVLITSPSPTETTSTTELASTSQASSTLVTTQAQTTASTTTTKTTTTAETTTTTTASTTPSTITQTTSPNQPTTQEASSISQPTSTSKTTSADIQKGIQSANTSDGSDDDNVGMIAGVGVVAAVALFFGSCGITVFACRQLNKKNRSVDSKDEILKGDQDDNGRHTDQHVITRDTITRPGQDETQISLPAWANF